MIRDYKDYKYELNKNDLYIISFYLTFVLSIVVTMFGTVMKVMDILSSILIGITFGIEFTYLNSLTDASKKLKEKYPKFRLQAFEERLKK